MHLHGEECPANNDSGKTKNMANCGLDIRLRRQAPVSIKPPRLRLAASSNGSSKGSTSRLSSLHTRQTSSPQRMQLNDSNKKGKENPSDLPAKKSPVDSHVEHHGSNSVSKLSGSSSVGRRFKSRSRAGVTSTTFSATATASSTERSLSIGSNNHASLSASVTKGLSRSCENVGISTFSTVRYDVSSSSNSGRPLIHHQRHNLKNRFQLLKTLGEGTYGKVKLAVDKTSGEHVAIKYIKKTKMVDDADLARIRREIQILSSLRHKHVVNIREEMSTCGNEDGSINNRNISTNTAATVRAKGKLVPNIIAAAAAAAAAATVMILNSQIDYTHFYLS
ncbi:nuak family snf1-like kinase 1 [Plakobranchus ocellatus]|uniref:Nuak family snf1-like kinase 1 n=1 Tax=Plakobranchus ocellatus TaxID=259542 RepID=A0AAV3Z8U4_9GAST|nr:nuak family snf1-like kinase 1 [Plakobranchus ocellatus]